MQVNFNEKMLCKTAITTTPLTNRMCAVSSHPSSRGREALFICLIADYWKTKFKNKLNEKINFHVLQRLRERLKAQNRLHYMGFSY